MCKKCEPESLTSYFGTVALLLDAAEKTINLEFGDLGESEKELAELAAQEWQDKPFLVFQIMQPTEELTKQLSSFFKENGVPTALVPQTIDFFFQGLQDLVEESYEN